MSNEALKKIIISVLTAAALVCALSSCAASEPEDAEIRTDPTTVTPAAETSEAETTAEETTAEETTAQTTSARPARSSSEINVSASSGIVTLESGLSAARFDGDYFLSDFIRGGGAKSDDDLASFLIGCALDGKIDLGIRIPGMGCSTLSAPAKGGGNLFGRNFDWYTCDALIVKTVPTEGYASVSTVNTDFIRQSSPVEASGKVLRFAAVYAPLDGMNEKGLCVSVNMVSDGDKVGQKGFGTDVTTTTAVRMLLDRAADVNEAIKLLRGCSMHFSYGYAVHFALCDASGSAAAVEYINGEMTVTQTPVLTNFRVARGSGGSGNSKARYDILMNELNSKKAMDREDMRSALKKAGKNNFPWGDSQYRSTEWSVIYDQKNLTATYYHRENFDKEYTVKVK